MQSVRLWGKMFRKKEQGKPFWLKRLKSTHFKEKKYKNVRERREG